MTNKNSADAEPTKTVLSNSYAAANASDKTAKSQRRVSLSLKRHSVDILTHEDDVSYSSDRAQQFSNTSRSNSDKVHEVFHVLEAVLIF